MPARLSSSTALPPTQPDRPPPHFPTWVTGHSAQLRVLDPPSEHLLIPGLHRSARADCLAQLRSRLHKGPVRALFPTLCARTHNSLSSMAPHNVVVRVVCEAVGALVELTEQVAAWISLGQAFSDVVPITGILQLARWFRWIPMASLRWCHGSRCRASFRSPRRSSGNGAIAAATLRFEVARDPLPACFGDGLQPLPISMEFQLCRSGEIRFGDKPPPAQRWLLRFLLARWARLSAHESGCGGWELSPLDVALA